REGLHLAGVLESVEVRDVRMVQRGEDSGFPFEAGEAVWVLCERLRQDFDGDVASEFIIPRAVDLAHPTHADQGGEFIRTDPGAGTKGQAFAVDYRGWRQRWTGLLSIK